MNSKKALKTLEKNYFDLWHKYRQPFKDNADEAEIKTYIEGAIRRFRKLSYDLVSLDIYETCTIPFYRKMLLKMTELMNETDLQNNLSQDQLIVLRIIKEEDTKK